MNPDTGRAAYTRLLEVLDEKAELMRENAELLAVLREWAEATRTFNDVDLAWDSAIYAGEDTGGYMAAWTSALARVKDAEANLRRLAEGEKP